MIHVTEHHDALLDLWRRKHSRGVRLTHVDFHDDLRGLVIGRRRGRAWPLPSLAPPAQIDPGNFLAHAVLEGRVDRITWLHDFPGGRAWDAGIVRFESDIAVWPRLLIHRLARGPEVALDFEERLLDSWTDSIDGEWLSIDWDCFASILQDEAGIAARCERFLARLGSARPAECFVVYSPEYSRPDLARFKQFVDRLARQIDQPVTWLSPGLREGRLCPAAIDGRLPPGGWMRFVLWLRRRGIY